MFFEWMRQLFYVAVVITCAYLIYDVWKLRSKKTWTAEDRFYVITTYTMAFLYMAADALRILMESFEGVG